jgi:hypothetical protein
MIQMKYAYTDKGFCRVHYKYKNKQGEWVMYCLMEDHDTVKMYRCSMDGEPDYVVVPSLEDLDLELPPDDYGQELYHCFFKGEDHAT